MRPSSFTEGRYLTASETRTYFAKQLWAKRKYCRKHGLKCTHLLSQARSVNRTIPKGS